MTTTRPSNKAILAYLKTGYKPRIKRVKGHQYIYLRRRCDEQEVSLGRFDEGCWAF